MILKLIELIAALAGLGAAIGIVTGTAVWVHRMITKGHES